MGHRATKAQKTMQATAAVTMINMAVLLLASILVVHTISNDSYFLTFLLLRSPYGNEQSICRRVYDETSTRARAAERRAVRWFWEEEWETSITLGWSWQYPLPASLSPEGTWCLGLSGCRKLDFHKSCS